MNKRTRYKISIGAGCILTALATLSILYGMEGAAVSAIAGIMTILSTYIWGETKRPSHDTESQ
ncbi:MAG: hypothetical protein KKA07_06665 [Bacteroidetes bacterium]|nr:hypothetical protein [Bacteroidota bacterium]